LAGQLPVLSASVCHGCGAERNTVVSPILTALSTVIMRC